MRSESFFENPKRECMRDSESRLGRRVQVEEESLLDYIHIALLLFPTGQNHFIRIYNFSPNSKHSTYSSIYITPFHIYYQLRYEFLSMVPSTLLNP